MSRIKLQTNEDGIAKFCPVTDFSVRIAANEMVIVVIQYVETIEQFDSGQPKQLQVVLESRLAQELAATIGKALTLFPGEDSNCLVQ
jgi:hypothetical protein